MRWRRRIRLFQKINALWQRSTASKTLRYSQWYRIFHLKNFRRFFPSTISKKPPGRKFLNFFGHHQCHDTNVWKPEHQDALRWNASSAEKLTAQFIKSCKIIESCLANSHESGCTPSPKADGCVTVFVSYLPYFLWGIWDVLYRFYRIFY